jgi:hypothetical protein
MLIGSLHYSCDYVDDGYFPISRAETEASVKVNHQLSDRDSIMLRYAFTNNREAGDAFNTAGWTDPSARGSSLTQDHAIVGSVTTILGPQSIIAECLCTGLFSHQLE